MLKYERRTWVAYESPFRLRECLLDMKEILGAKREMVVLKELTKSYEHVLRASIEKCIEYYKEREPKGKLSLTHTH